MNTDLQSQFGAIQLLLKQAAEQIQQILGGENVPPPASKARYESITKIEECYMWLANGVQSILQLDDHIEKEASRMAQEVASGPTLKVVE